MQQDAIVRDPASAPTSQQQRVRRIRWRYASPILIVHLVAMLAFVPWFFSWTGVVLALLGTYVFGTLGMNIGYHRLLTHRSFSCPRWLECSLAVLGACCLEESPTVWAALHRQHHSTADDDQDPHSPLTSFLWGHIGWLIIKSDNAAPGPAIARYATDLTRDPFYSWLEVSDNWIKVALLSWVAFFALGFMAVAVSANTPLEAVRFGASLVVWGAALRTVVVWHLTWSVNSVTHLWGYRNYDTADNSRNNILIGILANGEGWHNNHHAHPRSAQHGYGLREPDVAWLTIRGLMALRLARDVCLPSPPLRQSETRFPSPLP